MQEMLTIFDCYTYHSWYLWLFVVLFLLLNLEGKPMILFSNVLFDNDILELPTDMSLLYVGWHTYFWLAFLPLIVSGQYYSSFPF